MTNSIIISDRKGLHSFFETIPKDHSSAKTLIAQLKHQKESPSIALVFSTKTLLNTHHTNLLLKTNPAILKYLSKAQQTALEEDLILTFYGLCVRYQSQEIEHRRQHLSEYFSDIERCALLIEHLKAIKANQVLQAHKQATQTTEFGLKRWTKEKIQQIEDFYARAFSAGKTIYLRQWMTDFNLWRLYWVWAGTMLRTALSMIPLDFYHTQQTIDVVTTPQPILGYISWILYYARFLINFLLVLKHTIRGPWMSDEEKELIRQKGGSLNRLQEQLALRKFTLLNDLIWATTNLVCFFWLVGPTLGPFGDLLTVFLLMGDASLSLWARAEATADHQKELAFYDDEIQRLDRLYNSETPENLDIVQAQTERLRLARAQCEADWNHQSKQLNADLYYGIGLLASFAMMVVPWATVGATAAAGGLVLGSAGLCFVVSLIYSGYKAYIEVTKARESRMTALNKCLLILKSVTPPGENMSEADYIRYSDLVAEAEHQAQLSDYQMRVFMRSAILQSFIPLAIFSAFTFATLGIGAAVCAVGVVVALITHYIIEDSKPKEAASTEFCEADCRALDIESKTKTLKRAIEQTQTIGLVLLT